MAEEVVLYGDGYGADGFQEQEEPAGGKLGVLLAGRTEPLAPAEDRAPKSFE